MTQLTALAVASSDVRFSLYGSLFPKDHYELTTQLYDLEKIIALPGCYQQGVLRPFISYIEKFGEETFKELFNSKVVLTKKQEHQKLRIQEVAEALLQRGENASPSALRDLQALQELVEAIFYQSIQQNLPKTSIEMLPPLARWSAKKSPYQFSCSSFKEMNLRSGVIGYPIANQKRGLFAWAAVGHETAGHYFLKAVPDSVREIKEEIKKNLLIENETLKDYWSECAEETACDVLGVLTLGPASALGLLAHLKGARAGALSSTCSFSKVDLGKVLFISQPDGKLTAFRNIPDYIGFEKQEGLFGSFFSKKDQAEKTLTFQVINTRDKHPNDISRMFLLLEVIKIQNRNSYLIPIIRKEVDHDLSISQSPGLISIYSIGVDENPITIPIPVEEVEKSAVALAHLLMESSLSCFGNKSLKEMGSWSIEDDVLTEAVKEELIDSEKKYLSNFPLSRWTKRNFSSESMARYIVAAAVIGCITNSEAATPQHIETIFKKMKRWLSIESQKSV